MPEDMSNAEQERPQPREEQVAKRWLKMRGVTPPQETATGGLLDELKETVGLKGKSPKKPEQLVSQAYDLFVEKQDLKDDIVAKQREVMEPATSSHPLSLEEKRKLIQQGRISALLPSAGEALPYKEVIGKSQARIGEIDNQLDHVFTVPGIYDRFVQDLTHQVRVRHQAREARSLDRFVETADLVSVRLTREGQVQGRTLTSVEQGVVSDNRALREEAEKRKAELLKDPDVFDRARIVELQEYKHQIERRNGRFAVTPSRKAYVDKLEEWWANNNHVLLTGATGTGKTELVRYAAEKLFRKLPFKIPGDPDMNIYRLLGTTGLKVDKEGGGDVPRYSELLLAMGVDGGVGGPVLYDEIDATPNRANLSLKELLNRIPGQKVREDVGHKAFIIGKDYCLAATANVLGEKHPDRYPIGDEVIRIFRPLEVDYMPAYEVYDLALASLMDKRGGVPLTENDARVFLKNLCDAASWIQNAYQGRKIITDPASGTFLEARGQAATGKAATLKKALLDPGRTLDMLHGWTAAQTRGITFEDYINERLLEFINNRAYPEEDRYHLTEIFALKGFLKGHKISELMVSGLGQSTLDRWAGSVNRKQVAGKATPSYLSWNRVARLDPYRRFKRPVSAEAEELLEEEVPEVEEVAERGGPMIERAREVLGRDFLGANAIKKLEQELKKVGVNVEFVLDKLPPFLYTEEDLQTAKAFGEMLVLRPEVMLRDGREVPLTLIEFRELFRKDPLGKMQTVVYSFRTDANDWYKGEKFATGAGEIKLGWSLVKKDVLDGSTNINWNDQEQLLKQYEAGLRRKGAKHASIRRRTGAEVVYDELLYYVNTGERLLPDKYDWTQTRLSSDNRVRIGSFVSNGLHAYADLPEAANPRLGVCPSR